MLYKTLKTGGKSVHVPGFRWSLPDDDKPGEWMPRVDTLAPCKRGYHLCDGAIQLVEWLDAEIYEAEAEAEVLLAGNKVVAHTARLVRRCEHWTERTARLFAAACAEHVLPIHEAEYPDDPRPRKAIEAARAYARGEISADELAAARSAAWAAAAAVCDAAGAARAAGGAARAAAVDAAWAAWAAGAAARGAAGAAAWAAWDAARDAAWAAARAAACDAERAWQADLLGRLLRGEWTGEE